LYLHCMLFHLSLSRKIPIYIIVQKMLSFLLCQKNCDWFLQTFFVHSQIFAKPHPRFWDKKRHTHTLLHKHLHSHTHTQTNILPHTHTFTPIHKYTHSELKRELSLFLLLIFCNKIVGCFKELVVHLWLSGNTWNKQWTKRVGLLIYAMIP